MGHISYTYSYLLMRGMCLSSVHEFREKKYLFKCSYVNEYKESLLKKQISENKPYVLQ